MAVGERLGTDWQPDPKRILVSVLSGLEFHQAPPCSLDGGIERTCIVPHCRTWLGGSGRGLVRLRPPATLARLSLALSSSPSPLTAPRLTGYAAQTWSKVRSIERMKAGDSKLVSLIRRGSRDTPSAKGTRGGVRRSRPRQHGRGEACGTTQRHGAQLCARSQCHGGNGGSEPQTSRSGAPSSPRLVSSLRLDS